MLLISSMMTTVLPTPAPPNAPTLPPLVKGQIRSMTLMPVASTVALVSWSSKGRGGTMNRVTLLELDRAAFVGRLAEDVEDAAEDALRRRGRKSARRCP